MVRTMPGISCEIPGIAGHWRLLSISFPSRAAGYRARYRQGLDLLTKKQIHLTHGKME